MREPRLQELDRAAFGDRLDTLLSVYSAAMRPPPDQLPGRRMTMERHVTHPGFRCVVAKRWQAPVGFAYDFQGAPGQSWHDVVCGALAESHGPDSARRWMADSFEVAELHVLPAYQGRGLGRRLVTALCSGRSERTVVLSTHDRPSMPGSPMPAPTNSATWTSCKSYAKTRSPAGRPCQ